MKELRMVKPMYLGQSIMAVLALLTVPLVAMTTETNTSAPTKFGAIDDPRMVNAAKEPQNWMIHGGTYSGQYYSPLAQINENNVRDLGLAWSFDFDTNRAQESEPIVVDGVMYVTTAWSKVYALDAVTGKKLWFYDPKVPGITGPKACCDVVNRGAAVYKGKVYVGTLDGRLIALDARTGALAWSSNTVDDSSWQYTITGSPRIVRNKVIIGNGGADRGVRGYVSAYDTESGKLAWRFYTAPGDPSKGPDGAASDAIMEKLVRPTWAGEYWKYGGGATAWDAITYDPELNQLYIGTGNGSPWNPRIRTDRKGDNLFLCSVVALDPDTGKYKWHYQENPQESWDYNSVQPFILTDMTIGGKSRKVLYHAPKNGFFYIIDRETGKVLSANPLVAKITWTKGIDLKTGRPVEVENSRYENGPVLIAPNANGAHNWNPMALSAKTGLVYLMIKNNAMIIGDDPKPLKLEFGQFNTGTTGKRPDLAQTVSFIAFDPATGKRVWEDAGLGGGALATGGGLVFRNRGSILGEMVAYRATDGKVLWSQPTPNVGQPAPITYSINGDQYVAMTTGAGGVTAFSMPVTYGYSPGRMLVFKLGGKAKMPADPPPPPPANPSSEVFSKDVIAKGEETYGRYCGNCHGRAGESSGVIPDLRRSGMLGNKSAWQQIAFHGALEARGMHGWGKDDQISSEAIENVRAYVNERAVALKKTGDHTPTREQDRNNYFGELTN
jgi:quinohemoprotein ethanol dehydrogenase